MPTERRSVVLPPPVAGDPDIPLVSDLESGNMLAKQLEYLAGARAAGVVLGARAPIVLTSRSDKAETRKASSAIAVKMLHDRLRQSHCPTLPVEVDVT